MNGSPLTLSVIMPARDEAESIASVVLELQRTLECEGVPHEIIVVDDHSQDDTSARVNALALPRVRCIANAHRPGFGLAIRTGLDAYRGDAVAIVMADGSDLPQDVVRCYRRLAEGYDCVFGSRFMGESVVVDYPWIKLAINRVANRFIQVLFRIPLNDTTNAFKCYRRETIDGIRPILSNHFNLTVELPLKAIVRGYSVSVLPISWHNRTHGTSKLKIKEMGSRYLFIVLYVWLERLLARGDYDRQQERPPGSS